MQRTARWTGGRSEAAITTDTGAAPEGASTGSTEGGAAHAGDAGDVPAGTGGTVEVRLVLLTHGHPTPPDHAQKGSGRLMIPWDPTPFDSPQSPAPPRFSGLPYDQNFLFQKVAEG